MARAAEGEALLWSGSRGNPQVGGASRLLESGVPAKDSQT